MTTQQIQTRRVASHMIVSIGTLLLIGIALALNHQIVNKRMDNTRAIIEEKLGVTPSDVRTIVLENNRLIEENNRLIEENQKLIQEMLEKHKPKTFETEDRR